MAIDNRFQMKRKKGEIRGSGQWIDLCHQCCTKKCGNNGNPMPYLRDGEWWCQQFSEKSHIEICVLCHKKTDGTKSICPQCFLNSRNDTTNCPNCKKCNIKRKKVIVWSCNTTTSIDFYCPDCGCDYTQYYTLFFDHHQIH